MRVPDRERQRGLQFNITPLIDIVFLLIIFFLVSTHLVQSESQTEIEPPDSTVEDNEKEIPPKLIVTITPEGTYLVNNRETELPDVEQKILAGSVTHKDNFEVRIRGDKKAAWQYISPIILASAKSGVTRVKFAVRKVGG